MFQAQKSTSDANALKKQRCLVVGGKDLACIQDKAAIDQKYFWLGAAVIVLLLVRR